MGKIEALIFDWGGVIIENPATQIADYCANVLGADLEDYSRAYMACMDDFQTGKVSESQFWKNMTRLLHVPRPESSSLWGDSLAAVHRPMPGMISIVSSLKKAGYKIALLSNTELPAVDIFEKQSKYRIFDVAVFSCLEGTKKPESKIYEITLDRLKTTAPKTLFIDDRQDFIDGGTAVGLQTILFKSVEQFKKELSQFCLNVV